MSAPDELRVAGTTRARMLAAAILGVVLVGAALERLEVSAPEEPLSPSQLDALARGRDPGPGLLLGRALPLDGTSAAEWALVPGIGPRTAAALVAARPQTLNGLSQVRGLGPSRRATLARLARAH